ncbi:unnamed protein product, partial [Closterium sp. NIES-54]
MWGPVALPVKQKDKRRSTAPDTLSSSAAAAGSAGGGAFPMSATVAGAGGGGGGRKGAEEPRLKHQSSAPPSALVIEETRRSTTDSFTSTGSAPGSFPSNPSLSSFLPSSLPSDYTSPFPASASPFHPSLPPPRSPLPSYSVIRSQSSPTFRAHTSAFSADRYPTAVTAAGASGAAISGAPADGDAAAIGYSSAGAGDAFSSGPSTGLLYAPPITHSSSAPLPLANPYGRAASSAGLG